MGLDEVTQICPVPLPVWLSDSGGKGIQVCAVAHGEAQLAGRWGEQGKQVVLDTSSVKVFLPGITDTTHPGRRSKLCGQAAFTERGQDHHSRHDVATPDMIRQLPPGFALVIRGGCAPVIARLPRAWNDPAYRRARRRGQRHRRPHPRARAREPGLRRPGRRRIDAGRAAARPVPARHRVPVELTMTDDADDRRAAAARRARRAARRARRPRSRSLRARSATGSPSSRPSSQGSAGRSGTRPRSSPGWRALDEQVAALAARLAGILPDGRRRCRAAYRPGAGAAVVEAGRPGPRGRVARLRAWVEQVYRPGYGQLAATLGPCWEQHPLCLYGLDVAAELWSRALPPGQPHPGGALGAGRVPGPDRARHRRAADDRDHPLRPRPHRARRSTAHARSLP